MLRVKGRQSAQRNSDVEEVPRCAHISDEAERIVQQHLRSNREVEPPRVGGMSKHTTRDAEEEEARVNARLHQLVLLALRRFNVMTEVAFHLNLGACAQQPAAETEREAYPQRVHVHP